MQKEGRDPQISIDRKIYEFIIQEAKRHKRTIKGQTEYLIEIAKEEVSKDSLLMVSQSEREPEN